MMVTLFVRLVALSLLLILQPDKVAGFSFSTTLKWNDVADVGRRRRKIACIPKASADDNDNNNSVPLDMSILQQRMDHQQNQYAKLILEQSKYMEQESNLPESVHIILFNPDTPNQNVHTIEIPKGSGNNMILAFEDGGDCGMFARNLRELEFVDPSPQETMFEPFAQFCESMSIPVLIVPAGFDLSPPQTNANDGEEEDDDDDDDDLPSMSTLLEQKHDSAATVIIDDENDSWG